MKKFLTVILIFLCWTSLSGFKTVESGAILYANGTVAEVVAVQFEESDATKLGTNLQELITTMENISTSVKSHLESLISTTISYDENLSLEQKQDILSSISVTSYVKEASDAYELGIVITHINKSYWNYMCKTATQQVETSTSNLFTKTTSYSLDAKMCQVGLGNTKTTIFEATYTKIKNLLVSSYGVLKVSTILPAEYSYTYVTNVRRLHSDAPAQRYEYKTGYSYHTWTFDNYTDTQITLYTTSANAITWYVLAIVLTLAFTLTLLIVAKFKKEKKLD